MRKLFLAGALAVGYGLLTSHVQKGARKNIDVVTTEAGDSPKAPASVEAFKLSSPSFEPGQHVPQTHACDGDDISPALAIAGTPEGTQSFALIMDDPDSIVPPVFDHWLLWNIPADTTLIEQGTPPAGAVHGNNTLRNPKYNGPCTPNGTHRYRFKLYALDSELLLPPGASKAALEAAMKTHILAKSELIGLYTSNMITKQKLAVAMFGAAVKPPFTF